VRRKLVKSAPKIARAQTTTFAQPQLNFAGRRLRRATRLHARNSVVSARPASERDSDTTDRQILPALHPRDLTRAAVPGEPRGPAFCAPLPCARSCRGDIASCCRTKTRPPRAMLTHERRGRTAFRVEWCIGCVNNRRSGPSPTCC
jgi:hypothetical protein